MPHNIEDDDLEINDLPPFPADVATVPLLRISLSKLLMGDQTEVDRLWKASCELGFFYLDLTPHSGTSTNGTRTAVGAESNGALLSNVDELFKIGESVFELPVSEKVKYDFKSKGSYFGYKGYGDGIIDSKGTKDRNEFYNVSKDDILDLSDPLPAPELLERPRPIIKSYMQQCHTIVTLILHLLNERLGLPSNTLPSLHRLRAISGDQLRWVYAPPQPFDDRKTALGEHTDFGSVTVLFNRLGGLQVLPPNSDGWKYVKPLRNHAVVNLGDAMVKFSAGILRSNIHRVVNPPGDQGDLTRMSLVYFARPEDDVTLKALEGSEMIDEAKKSLGQEESQEISAKDWILKRALGRRTGGKFSESHGTEARRTES
ncbi:putative 1-aminocyclopropane-1-carboxylate oxidase [Myriangium duriaei CBS 260.36]|uniref:1-aminocyclopropane-1-carboxylate oxidase n=1 Tax=Myriangium duriaei CBS 260.36 TaxID=1168546 RepID=A0A9P4MLX7_9PEZI|nr:putative 1-aminocyclopropane-1-carboxylate oxidase [Myriangium duriaei CBS 260.36]